MIAAAVVLSKTFNNGFDFERGLWRRKMRPTAYAPQKKVFVATSIKFGKSLGGITGWISILGCASAQRC